MSQVKGAIGHGRALLAVYAFSRRPHALFYQALALRSVSSLRQENREASAFSSSTGSLNHSNEPQVHNMSIFSSIRGGATVNERAMAQGNDTSIERKDSRYSITEFFVQFIKGTKTLWAEIGAARETRARKKVGESLTLQEERLLRQVPRDVAKAMPLLTIFAIPFAGYIAPLVGFFFPKTLLPSQFWTLPQRLDYLGQDATQQEGSAFPKLLRSLAMLESPPRPNSTPQQLRARTRWFAEEGRLEGLPRRHLLRLVKVTNTMSPFKKAAANFFMKAQLVAWLLKEAACISKDDLVLRKLLAQGWTLPLHVDKSNVDTSTGVSVSDEISKDSKLSLTEVEILCWERGILRSEHCPKSGRRDSGGRHSDQAKRENDMAMLRSLEEWLSLYDDDAETQPEFSSASKDGSSRTLSRTLPSSMVLHAPALLRLSYSAQSNSPVCHLRVQKATR